MTRRSSGAPAAPLTLPPGHWKESAHLIFRIGRYVFASGDFRTSWSTAGESTAFFQGCAPCAGSGISIPDDAAPLPALGEGHRRSNDKSVAIFWSLHALSHHLDFCRGGACPVQRTYGF